MQFSLKNLFENYKRFPEDKFPPELSTPQHYRAFYLGNYAYPTAGLCPHCVFMVVFALMGVTSLSFFNIGSVILWFIAILIHRRGFFWIAYLIITIEIIAHAAACTAVIGWGSGFQYYLLTGPAAVFLLPWSTARKVVVAVIYTFSYAAMNYYASLTPPYVELRPIFLNALNYGNIFSFCTILAIISYYYYQATQNAEEKLEQEHQRANAALIERNQALERLNEELSEAADYVRTILPEPITKGAIHTDWRFVPSTSLGGDAFGYHWVDEDYFALYLIDVSGHGVGAALLSVSVMNVLRSQSLPNTDFKDPEQVLGSLNVTFPGEENNDMYFTIWYGVYNRNIRELTYASGGHPPALLVTDTSADDSQITPLRTPNHVIGGMPESTYQKREHVIGEQSTLYIFSDGVYEVEKSDGSMWCFREFLDFMHQPKAESQSRLDRIYHYAKSLGHSEDFEDDFTIVEVVFA